MATVGGPSSGLSPLRASANSQRRITLKFRLSSLLSLVLSIAILAAWWTDHTVLQNEVRRLNQQATEIATQLYQEKVRAGVIEPQTAIKAMFSSRPYSTLPGVVVDLRTESGRVEFLERLKNGDSDFTAKSTQGHIIFTVEARDWRAPAVATETPMLPYEQ